MKRIALLIFVSVFMFTGCVASNQPTPKSATTVEDFHFHDIVDVEFVKQNISVPMPANVMLIDARPKRAKYDKGHIPLAVSIPDSQFAKMTDKLPANKNTLIIYYCGGEKCKLSHKSAKKAEALGYTNVKVFAKGFPGWLKNNNHYPAVSADWLKKQVDANAEMTLIDSRPKRAKYDKGHIPTAISIPDTFFAKSVDQLPTNKDALVVFYCGGLKCKLSHKSAQKAKALGYTNVKVFSGGFPAWKKVVQTKENAPTGGVAIKSGKEEGSIAIDVFQKIVKDNPGSIYLIDVRDPDEFKTGSFASAINIPVDTLEGRINKLATDKPIVFICGTGARSGESFYMAKDIRPDVKEVYYLDAEMTIKQDGSFEIKKQ